MNQAPYEQDKTQTASALSSYGPLIALILIAAAAGAALMAAAPPLMMGGLMIWMHYFMGFFLCCFAMLKLFNPSKFADGFQKYDLVAGKSRSYALIYPYIELALGLAYLAFFMPVLTYSATIIVMGVGAIGVVRALRQGLNINCPCMGSVLAVPLSTVTLTEDLAMGLMALAMLIMVIGA